MAWTAPKTWAYKETLSSSDLNTYVSANLSYLKDLFSIVSGHDHNGGTDDGKTIKIVTANAASVKIDYGYAVTHPAGDRVNFASGLFTAPPTVVCIVNDGVTGSGVNTAVKNECTKDYCVLSNSWGEIGTYWIAVGV